MNLQKMMKQAQDVQNKMGEMQARLEEEETEGSSGGGMVKIVMSGKGSAKRLSVDASLLKAEEKEMLEDLIVAAINDAKTKIDSRAAQEMSKLASGLGLPPGMKLPF